MSALVEKKTGFDGKRTLIQDGLCAWCSAGSILAQDMADQINERHIEKQPALPRSGSNLFCLVRQNAQHADAGWFPVSLNASFRDRELNR